MRWLLVWFLAGSWVSGEDLFRADFQNQPEQVSEQWLLKDLKLTAKGVDASGSWTNVEKWAVNKQANTAVKNCRFVATLQPSQTGNSNALAQFTFRSRAGSSDGVGVQVSSFHEGVILRVVENGKVTEEKQSASLEYRTRPIKLEVVLHDKSLSVRVCDAESGGNELALAAQVSVEQLGYFFYRAISANEGPTIANWALSSDEKPEDLALKNWPPSGSAPLPKSQPAQQTGEAESIIEPELADVPVSNQLVQDVRVLSPDWLCLVMDSMPAARAYLNSHATFQKELADAAAGHARGERPWYWPIVNDGTHLLASTRVRRHLCPKYESAEQWKVGGSIPQLATYVPQAIDGIPISGVEPAPKEVVGTRVAEFVYLKLSEPLKPGQTVNITHQDGLEIPLTFDSRKALCWGLKVNQLGYLPDTRKFAYLGSWAGFTGAVDYESFQGQPFEVLRYQAGDSWRNGAAVGEPVLTGKIQLRAKSEQQI
ncbi:MAG: hypothetical protein AAF226_11370, partial [Verrucomicrobiota bacterium]